MKNSTKLHQLRNILLIFLSFLLIYANFSFGAHSQIEGFLSMDLEELMNVEVTSAFKKAQNIKEVPAAVYVITQDDIRRSGATSIPELLRMVPGVNVAKIDNGSWAISIRGFNGLFSDKLLVLMDGRTLYDSLFSGVFWDVQDTLLEDIDRIEVIRGPGASSWGTNAVNGVINIITKNANDTKGGLVSITSGNQERLITSARYGIDLNKLGAVRFYVKHFDRHQQKDSKGVTAWDAWHMDRIGTRSDLSLWNIDVSLKGEIYSGEGASKILGFEDDYSTRKLFKSNVPVSGGFIISDFFYNFSKKAKLSLRFYYDRTERKYSSLAQETRDILDFEFQNSLKFFDYIDFIWGGIYRHTSDFIPMEHDTNLGAVVPKRRKDDLFSLFFQNDMSFLNQKLHLLAGVRFDHYNYSDFEIQPTFRMLYSISDIQDIWLAVSRAVRNPSRYNRDAIWVLDSHRLQDNQNTIIDAFVGSEDFKSEELWAYEIGYRWMSSYFTLDLAIFANFYRDLITLTSSKPFFHYQYLIVPRYPKNFGEGEIFGLEFTTNIKPYKWWRLECSYSYLDTHFWVEPGHRENSDFISFDSPNHKISFRSTIDIFDNLEFDMWFKYISNLRQFDVPSYLGLDIRLGWHVSKNLELSIAAKDLLDSYHSEFKDHFLNIVNTEVPRSIYGKITWCF